MSDTLSQPEAAVTGSVAVHRNRAEWFAFMDKTSADEGYFLTVGDRHWAFFHDDGPVLLVTFEQIDTVRERANALTYGHDIARENGWSHLCLISEGETWYRDPAVYAYIDRLVDEAFFEDFDKVVFYGAGSAGYAACAFSVAAPGATVLAISPRATLSPAVTGWDKRHLSKRKLDFTSRYGYGPDMTEGAARVHIIHDPKNPPDAMHAALFRAPWVRSYGTPFLGEGIEASMILLSLLPALIKAAADETLDAGRFAKLWRSRRSFGPYLRAVLRENESRPRRALGVCRSVVARLGAPRFRRRMLDLEAMLGLAPVPAQGGAAPAALPAEGGVAAGPATGAAGHTTGL